MNYLKIIKRMFIKKYNSSNNKIYKKKMKIFNMKFRNFKKKINVSLLKNYLILALKKDIRELKITLD